MFSLTEMIIRLDQMGLTGILLPFLLIFSIMFAIMSNVGVLGANRKIHGFISFAIAMLVVVPHITGSYPPGADVVAMMNTAIPNVTGVVVAAIMFLILLGLFGLRPNLAGTGLGGIFILLSAVIIFAIFGSSAGWFDLGLPPWLSFLNDPDTQALVVVLLMFWAVISLITAKPRPDDAAFDSYGVGSFLKFFADGFNPPRE
jgi:hypothetical protein